MGSLKVYATVAGFLAVATSVTTARAADLLPPPPAPPPAPYVEPVAEVGGGWYLRGDVGASSYSGGKFSHPDLPRAEFYGEDFGSGGFVGAGVGYRFNNWFRADVTGEFRFSTGVNAYDREQFYSNTVLINGNESYKGKFSSGVFLVNGYVDLGSWHGLTPFIGAGVGYANNRMHSFETSTMNFYPGFPTLNPGINGGTIRNHTYGNLAWALHAGLAYDVTPNLKLELAYRYLNLGDAYTGGVNCYCGNTTNVGFKAKDIESHDIKLGMRWALGGGAVAAPVYEPAPLMRKY